MENPNYTYATEPHKIVASTVIKHFDAPRREARRMTRHQSLNAKARAPLSPDERAEIGQTVALVLIERAAFDKLPRLKAHRLRIWRECFIASRAVIQRLRATCAAREELFALNWSDAFDADGEELFPMLALPHPDAQMIFETRLLGKTRAALRCIRAAYQSDKSRKRKAARNGARDALRYCLTGVLPRANLRDVRFANDAARRKAIERFQAYLSRGLAVMFARPIPAHGEQFRCFADLCAALDAGTVKLQKRISHASPRV